MRMYLASRAYLFVLLFCCTVISGSLPIQAQAADGPRVDVLMGPDASRLDQYAAQQLCHYLHELFGVNTEPARRSSADAQLALIIGGPANNPAAVRALDGAAWPEISDQGIVLKPVQLNGKPALIVGGDSDRATLWAVYELVERWGVRFLTDRDVLPETRPTVAADGRGLPLPQTQVVLEPKLPIRQWRVINDFACGPESWGIADYRRVLDQLAKLKFNRIYVSIYAWQPFLDLRHGGIQRKEAWLWYDFHYPLTADMPGRSLFDNRAEFWNPDLPLGATYRKFADAGQRHVNAIMNHAKSRGFEVAMVANVAEFPREFAPLLKDYRKIYPSMGHSIGSISDGAVRSPFRNTHLGYPGNSGDARIEEWECLSFSERHATRYLTRNGLSSKDDKVLKSSQRLIAGRDHPLVQLQSVPHCFGIRRPGGTSGVCAGRRQHTAGGQQFFLDQDKQLHILQ